MSRSRFAVILFGATVFSLGIDSTSAATTDFTAAGENAAAIQGTVDSFRAALGAPNANGPCAGPCVPGVGRREINWDGVPDANSSGGGNPFPGDFFNQSTGSAAGRIRGAQFSTTGAFEVSADSDSDNDGNPGPVAILFGNHSADNAADFAAFSPQRIFGLVGTNQLDVTFSPPGEPGSAALVKGLGVVFTDAEVAGSTKLEFFDAHNQLVHTVEAPPFVFSGSESFKSFSFAGSVFDSATIARVHITNGDFDLALTSFAGGDDAVAMDDFIYGEPVPVPVPEPETWAMIGLGLAAVALARRRSRAGTDCGGK